VVVESEQWPTVDGAAKPYLVTVGANPPLAITPIDDLFALSGLVGKLASMVLRAGYSDAAMADGVYTERDRLFDRVTSGGNGKIVVTDERRGRVCLFDCDTLLLERVYKGVRGVVVLDGGLLYHPRTGKFLNTDSTALLRDGEEPYVMLSAANRIVIFTTSTTGTFITTADGAGAGRRGV
jgi:hypothetical protein